MLTRIAVVTGILTAAVQGAVLFGLDITQDQQAWITGFIVLVGAGVHSWFNPSVPFGKTDGA